MVLRIDMRKEPIGLGITKTSSVDKKTIKTKFEKDQLIIEIPDMPRLEKIEIDIFSGSYVSSYRPVSGGDKNFVLKSKTNWLWFWGNALTVVAAVGINLMVWGN